MSKDGFHNRTQDRYKTFKIVRTRETDVKGFPRLNSKHGQGNIPFWQNIKTTHKTKKR